MHERICWEIVPYTTPVAPTSHGDRGKVLDIGCDMRKAFPHFVGIDTIDGVDYKVADLTNLADFEDAKCDAVFSAWRLQKIEDREAALREWSRLVMERGHLIVYLPSAENPPSDEPGVKADDIVSLMRVACPSGWALMERQERAEERAFLLVFRKGSDGVFDEDAWQRAATQRILTPKRVCLVRYGGYGDMLQVASVLPQLKAEGWHVTVMTEPKGKDILRDDPHIDEFFIQANDQVPNHLLGEYWKYWATRFDRFVNFSESIEGTLLAMPGRISHQWPLPVRQKHLNLNYFEWMAELAGVDFVGAGRFYGSPAEEEWAKKERHAMGGFVVLFALSGSSVHKFYRWQDEVIGGLLRHCPKARVVTIGDAACKILEQGWEKEPRVICKSGEWSIRETLAFAREADAVIGPETGVLNSVANDPVLKVCLLSHSSHENLTKHWVNTAALEPVGQHCYPCHQLHYSTEFCDIDPDSATAMCQVRISPERALLPLVEAYGDWSEKRYGSRPRIPSTIPMVVQ